MVRETPDGGTVRVRDVARIELGSQDYSVGGRFNGKPSAVLALYQLPGSNAVDAAAAAKKLMNQVRQRFPEDLDFVVAVDTTRAVTEGIKEIVDTLVIALVLVILVVYIFLQGWRATLIPLLAVPVSLVGTFALFPLFGFSINTLSLFGLVLAIGLVVDDAIVVVEGVERHIEEGMTPKDAALKAMEELSGPVVGIALVLSAVFVPTAFIPGITGRLYQQFAVTIAISVLLSAFNALTLSPALAALLLRPKKPMAAYCEIFRLVQSRVRARHRRLREMERCAGREERRRGRDARRVCRGGLVFLESHADELPARRRPGLRLRQRPTPERRIAGTNGRRRREVEKIMANTPGVQYSTGVVGFSLISYVRTSYNATFLVTLKPWDERTTREEQFQTIKAHLNQHSAGCPRQLLQFLAAGDSGCGHIRRIYLRPRGPRGQ